MYETHVRPSRDLRNNYTELAKLTAENNDEIIITNQGKAETVLIGFSEYESWKEYKYNRYVMAKLKEAEQGEEEAGAWTSRDDFFKVAREL